MDVNFYKDKYISRWLIERTLSMLDVKEWKTMHNNKGDWLKKKK